MTDEQTEPSGSIYSFGETNLAAERLRVVSEVFDPTSEAFISESVQNRPGLALDLGCGPGFTTRLLSRVARPKMTVGVDRSDVFLSKARASAGVGEDYIAGNVAAAPLRITGNVAQPDLIYARFLCSHLPEPEQAVVDWAKELAAGGLLLLEEVDSINTEIAAFDEYLKIASKVLAQFGNDLFVGARLAISRWAPDFWIELNRTAEVRPTTGQAATMFSMNLPSWRRDPYVEATYAPDKLERLATELDALISFEETGRIVWQMRQIALRHHPDEFQNNGEFHLVSQKNECRNR